ncbi:ACT domain-containing protein [Candidatus Magnetomoraceae bacterium gMMP-15]
MRVEQISVFLENKAGRLQEVTGILSESGVNIRALSLADTSDFGVLRAIVDNTEKAKKALKAQGFTVSKTDVIAVEVEDSPGGLHYILDILGKSNVNIEYLYAFVKNSGGKAVIICRFDNIDEAIKVLTQNKINIIEGSRLYDM